MKYSIIRELEERLYLKAKQAETEHKIISASRCFKGGYYYQYFFEGYIVDYDIRIFKNNIIEIDKVVDKFIEKISELDKKELNCTDSVTRSLVPENFRSDKEVTIEDYHKNDTDCFHNSYIDEIKKINTKYITKEQFYDLVYVEALIAEKNNQIICATGCLYEFCYEEMFDEIIEKNNWGVNKILLSEAKSEIYKVLNEISKNDIKILNDKDSSFRAHIPLKFQSDKKVTIKDYEKKGDECFYNDNFYQSGMSSNEFVNNIMVYHYGGNLKDEKMNIVKFEKIISRSYGYSDEFITAVKANLEEHFLISMDHVKKGEKYYARVAERYLDDLEKKYKNMVIIVNKLKKCLIN